MSLLYSYLSAGLAASDGRNSPDLPRAAKTDIGVDTLPLQWPRWKDATTVKLTCLLCEDKDRRQEIADLVTTPGAMENNIDAVISRRFKKHGMS